MVDSIFELWTVRTLRFVKRLEKITCSLLDFSHSERSKMKYGERKVHEDRLSEANGQIRNKMQCGSDTSGPILSRNTINLLSSA